LVGLWYGRRAGFDKVDCDEVMLAATFYLLTVLCCIVSCCAALCCVVSQKSRLDVCMLLRVVVPLPKYAVCTMIHTSVLGTDTLQSRALVVGRIDMWKEWLSKVWLFYFCLRTKHYPILLCL
jgi:hypothetical protein